MRIEIQFIDENSISARTDFNATLGCVRLTFFVERHNDCASAVTLNQLCVFTKNRFALFQTNRVNNRFALNALQTSFDDFPFRRIDHNWNATNIWFRRDQIQKTDHCFFRIDQAFVHIDVDDVCAIFDLLASNRQRLIKIAFANQPREFCRACNVCTLANHHKTSRLIYMQRLETSENCVIDFFDRFTRRKRFHRIGDRANVFRRSSATSAIDIRQFILGKRRVNLRHCFRRIVIFAKRIRQTSVCV